MIAETKKAHTVNATISPEQHLRLLSQAEVAQLRDKSDTHLFKLFRKCALAILGSSHLVDDGHYFVNTYPDFDIDFIQENKGIKLSIKNAPADAFVDGVMITGIKEHLFSALRDIIFITNEIESNPHFDFSSRETTTNAIFHILRHANVFRAGLDPNLVVCWGGHSISKEEYQFTKEVGYQLGLRQLDVCTGCGPGAMKGPMKGATIAHAKQRNLNGRYIGLTEPGIIAAEAPNAIVNDLVILPDIEKRLEAFVRLGHGVIVFPGGAGTAEEILYLLGILLHPNNKEHPFPFIWAGNANSAEYFEKIDQFIGATLGAEAQSKYEIIIDEPAKVAQAMTIKLKDVRQFRKDKNDAFYYNWSLYIPEMLQHKFEPTHANMLALDLHKDQSVYEFASQLRCAFSGIVAGNVKEEGTREIAAHGPYVIDGDKSIMALMDNLLKSFVAQQRMKLPGSKYEPCYVIKT